jgi:hypothetical protein
MKIPFAWRQRVFCFKMIQLTAKIPKMKKQYRDPYYANTEKDAFYQDSLRFVHEKVNLA